MFNNEATRKWRERNKFYDDEWYDEWYEDKTYRITRDGELEIFGGGGPITINQAAEITGMNPEWMRRQCRLGRVRGAYRLSNGHWMIDPWDAYSTRIMTVIDQIRKYGDNRPFDEIIRQWAREEDAPAFVDWLESGAWMR